MSNTNKYPEVSFTTPLGMDTPELILSTQHNTQHDAELGEVNMFTMMVAAVDSLSPITHSDSTYPYLPHTYHQAISAPDGDKRLAAMHDQLKKLQDANTWDLIFLLAGRRPIANKWVFSKKDGAKAKLTDDDSTTNASTTSPSTTNASTTSASTTSASLHSARLVAGGDLQTKGVDYDETFALVVKLVSLRMLLAYAAFNDLDLVHWDIVAAFLNGDLKEEVYMCQPQGFDDGTGRVCKLHKSIYGLCQSARAFYQKLDSILLPNGWVRLNTEWAVWKDQEGHIIGCHVDDMCVAASPTKRKALMACLESHGLVVNDLGNLDIYIGLRIERDRQKRQIYLSQEEYVLKTLKAFGMDDCKPIATPMCHGYK